MKRLDKILSLLLLLGLLLIFSNCHNNYSHQFTRVNPEEKSFSPEKLDTLATFLEKSGASSMLLLVDGDIIFDWGNTHKKHLIHSVRKCMLNSLIGIAVAEGKIDTSKTLRELGIQDIEPKLSENDYNYDGNDIYQMLDLVFNARLK